MSLMMLSSLPVTEDALAAGLLFGALLLGLAVVVFIVAAFFSALFARIGLGTKFLWIVLIFVAPFIGALLWFLVGRPRTG
ncbi:PLDc N-terminal domain-containing protein [Nocardiopsis xinjiangensis]|uniref:PLDc N-terminal domain-containing protein n=1 Tax=Nocardiopsis xinjiangensis TaxID=124285 RepID=UPI0003470367|nr:PLDc N-terminal domain-containing protein [Nocardiopsis xinjiangensis]